MNKQFSCEHSYLYTHRKIVWVCRSQRLEHVDGLLTNIHIGNCCWTRFGSVDAVAVAATSIFRVGFVGLSTVCNGGTYKVA